MTEDLRDCPGCGSERPFILSHPELGCCPDSADGWCPEWFCAACGTALLAGMLPIGRNQPRVSGSAADGQLNRVA